MIIINGFKKIEWQTDMNITKLFDIMGYNYSLITVTVNDEVIQEEDYDSFYIPDNADVRAIHLCHGG